jgi:hypothetical protein
MTSPSWTLFVDQYPQVLAAYRRMARLDWFVRDGWGAFVGYYTHGIFMQVYKPHWYNQTFDGIHFELALDATCVANKTASIQLHITHKAVLPDREQFNALTIPRMKQFMSDWDSRYELSETKLSERLNLNVPFTKSNYAPKIAEAFAQICQLGPIIDDALAELWPQP